MNEVNFLIAYVSTCSEIRTLRTDSVIPVNVSYRYIPRLEEALSGPTSHDRESERIPWHGFAQIRPAARAEVKHESGTSCVKHEKFSLKTTQGARLTWARPYFLSKFTFCWLRRIPRQIRHLILAVVLKSFDSVARFLRHADLDSSDARTRIPIVRTPERLSSLIKHRETAFHLVVQSC